jgi:hypothetical protein
MFFAHLPEHQLKAHRNLPEITQAQISGLEGGDTTYNPE